MCHTGRGTRYEVCRQLILRSDLALLQTMFDLKHDISVNRRDRAILRSDLVLLQTMLDVVHIPHTLHRVPYNTYLRYTDYAQGLT